MIIEGRERLIRTMREDSTLFGLTGGRIYPQELATIINPKYPCVTVRIDSGNPDTHIPAVGYPRVIINFYSTKNYNESYTLYERSKDLLLFSINEDSNIVILLREISLPVENYDPIAKSYNLSSRWNMVVFEK